MIKCENRTVEMSGDMKELYKDFFFVLCSMKKLLATKASEEKAEEHLVQMLAAAFALTDEATEERLSIEVDMEELKKQLQEED